MEKFFVEQNSLEAKVKGIIPMYEPLEVIECQKKGGNIIAEPKGLIRAIVMNSHSLSSVFVDTARAPVECT